MMTSKLPPSRRQWPLRSRPLSRPSLLEPSCPLLCRTLPLNVRSHSITSKANLTALYSLLSLLASVHVVQSQDNPYPYELHTTPPNITSTVPDAEQVIFPRPENVTAILVNWYPPAVRVNWVYSRSELKNCKLQAFQIIYRPVKSRYRIIQEVPPYFTNITLDRLEPGIEYSVRINAISESGITNQSRLIHFVSPDNETRRTGSYRKYINRSIHTYPDEITDGLQVREDEVVIVVLVILGWIGCICLFFNKWGKIRMLEPYQPQYKESFHNSVHSIHPKPSRMNTCTSVPPNMISIESRGSLIADREMLLHHSRLTESGQLYQCASGATYHHPAYRPRLNSVFVGNPYHRDSLYPEPNMPRKVKSAEDLKSLVVQVNNNIPSTSTSVL